MTITDELSAAAKADGSSRQHVPGRRYLAAAGGAVVVACGVVRLALVGGAEVAVPFVVAGGVLALAALAGWWRTAATVGGVIAVALVASPAAPELAFNLVRPDETGWFLWSVALLAAVGLVVAAVVAGRPAARPRGPGPASALIAVAGVAVVAGGVLLLGGASAPEQAPDGLALPEVELFDASFGDLRFAEDRDGDRWARLVNDTAVPHTFTATSLGVDVYVPAGRDAVVRLPASGAAVPVICTIGDHADLGMVATVRP